MANDVIGHVKCWCCGSGRASVSVSKRGLVCVTCRACHMQTFARSAYSDAMIRQSMTPVSAAPAMPEPAPGMEIAPKPAPVVDVAAAVEPKRPEPAQKKRGAWDLW